MSFASRLREQRIQMNLTQAELAEALGVTKVLSSRGYRVT